MHHEYAVEEVVYAWESGNTNDTNILSDIAEDQILDLAEIKANELSNETMISIITNMREAETVKYKKVTRKQRQAVSSFLLGEFKTIPQVLSAAFNMPTSDLFDEIEVTAEEAACTTGQVVTLTIGYIFEDGTDELPVSKKLLFNYLLSDLDTFLANDKPVSVLLNGKKFWVTFSEFKSFNLEEIDVKCGEYR